MIAASATSLPLSAIASAKPRTSWLRITPELPRAVSSSDARQRRALLLERGVAEDAGLLVLGADRVEGGVEAEVEVGARVAVGDGEDVERVDLGPPRGEGGPREHGPAPRVHGTEGFEHGGRLAADAVIGPVLAVAPHLGYS